MKNVVDSRMKSWVDISASIDWQSAKGIRKRTNIQAIGYCEPPRNWRPKRDGIDPSSWKESDEESSRASIILPPRYCLGGDISFTTFWKGRILYIWRNFLGPVFAPESIRDSLQERSYLLISIYNHSAPSAGEPFQQLFDSLFRQAMDHHGKYRYWNFCGQYFVSSALDFSLTVALSRFF